jgi:rod shape determining protein RodA
MFSQFAWPVYGVVILLLILVLIVGKEVNGAKAWFGIGSFAIQPSEFSKMATSLVLARFITAADVHFRSFKTRLSVLGIILVPAGLILLQPDVGTLLVFTAFIFPMYREGLSGNILIFGLAGLVLGVVSILMTFSTFDYPFVGEGNGIYTLGVIIIILGALAFLINKGFSLPRYRKKNSVVIIILGIMSLGFMGSISWVMTSDQVLKDYQKERIQIML